MKFPLVLLPTVSVPAVMFARVAAARDRVPAPPFKPIVVPAAFGTTVTVAALAFNAPVAFKVNVLVDIFMLWLFDDTVSPFATETPATPVVFGVVVPLAGVGQAVAVKFVVPHELPTRQGGRGHRGQNRIGWPLGQGLRHIGCAIGAICGVCIA